MLQLDHLKPEVDRLQHVYGNPELHPVYGTGCTTNPRVLFLFMNPTAKNVSSFSSWEGLRAPWIGTKNVWKILHPLRLLQTKTFEDTQTFHRDNWTPEFVHHVYQELHTNSAYITNLAKCTQDDARGLKDAVFKEYLENTLDEIYQIHPEIIISFGNQVSSILLGKDIKVSTYEGKTSETLNIKDRTYPVYPVYYPVGQGMRNIHKAIARLECILGLG